jgi:lambda repressor-like predicted transcriptional regulator
MTVLKEKGPLWTACVGEEIWPDKRFKSRQGAALAGGGLMGKLRKRGLVERKYERGAILAELRFKGWALTAKGRAALEKAP